MQTHQLSRGMSVFALALAIAAMGCSAESGGPNEQESIGQTSEAIIGSDNHEYLFFTTPMTRLDAEARCESIDTLNRYRLAVPDNEEEQAWLTQEENNHQGGHWWIGVNDTATEGTFSTAFDGGPFLPPAKPIKYSHWHGGEPNNNGGNEDCVMDNYFKDGSGSTTEYTWNDTYCGNTAKFVCERGGADDHQIDNPSDTWYEVANTNSAQRLTVGYPFFVKAGQAVTVGTCDVGIADSKETNTYLRVFNQVGQQVAFNDDACGLDGHGSNVSFIAATTGMFTIKAGCHENEWCSAVVDFSVN